jgi:hypothetical protein
MKLLALNKIEEYGSDFANFDCSFLFYKDVLENVNVAYEDSDG